VQVTLVYGRITPNDPSYSVQWGPAKVDAPLGWFFASGAGVTVAIVDTGVDLNHPEFSGRFVPGRHFFNNGSQDSAVQDDQGHGTHVAGIAAATGNNGIGVAGMAWQAKILPVKVLASDGTGWTSDVALGVTWATDQGAKVVNLSLGGEQQSSTLLNATNYAYSHGSLVIAAAGNCGDSNYSLNGCTSLNPTFYPAANPNVVGVGATDSNDTRASFSEYGSFVDVTAPGVNIYSTLWTAAGSTYGTESGTSMAAPLVSGLAALVWSRNPGLTNAQVVTLLQNSAVPLPPGTPGRNDQYGYGRVNAGAAVVGATPLTAMTLRAARPEAPAPAVLAPEAAGQTVRPGVVLVRFKPAALTALGEAVTLARYNAQATGAISAIGVTIVSVPAGSERATAAALAADPVVEYAEPDYQLRLIQ
jgi:subtilisin family serine protease